MTPDEFVANFETVAEAPEGIKRLRELVLNLAVRGCLVEQRHDEGTAQNVISAINDERSRLLKAGKLRAARPMRDSDDYGKDDSEPYLLPASWAWTKLRDLSACETNAITDGPFGTNLMTAHYVAEPGFRVVRLGNIGVGEYLWDKDAYIDESRFQRLAKHHVFAGDLLIAGLADPVGRACLVPDSLGPALVKADCYRMKSHPAVDRRFLMHVLNAPTSRAQAEGMNHGITRTRINLSNLRSIIVPLPPLAEQKRIVAKVDQLMALCDDLEARQAKKRETAVRLNRAALDALTSAEGPEEVAASFRRVAENFELLAETENGPDQLRTLIVTLAISGRLVHSSDLDQAHCSTPPALDQADASPLPELPSGWRWLRVDQVGDVKLGRQRSPQNHTGPNMRPYLRVANVHEARIDISHVLEMNFRPDEVTRFVLSPEDILLNEGQSYELVGRPAMYQGEIPGACFQNTLIRFRAKEFTLPQYALIVFRAYLRNGRFRREAQQTTNMAHLSAGRLATIEFPLPPVAEQARIVAKVDQLMALCDTLEAALRRAESTAQKLAEAVVAEIVAPLDQQ